MMATNNRFTHVDIANDRKAYIGSHNGVPYMLQKAAEGGQGCNYAATLLLRGGSHVQIKMTEACRVIDSVTALGPISQDYRDDILDMIRRRCHALNLELRDYERPKAAPPTVEEIVQTVNKKFKARLKKAYQDPDGPPTRKFQPTVKENLRQLGRNMKRIRQTEQLRGAIMNLNLDLGAPGNHGRYR